jgi:hypothetical protein
MYSRSFISAYQKAKDGLRSSVGIMTELRAGRPGESRQGKNIFFLQNVQTGLRVHPAFYLTGSGTFSLLRNLQTGWGVHPSCLMGTGTFSLLWNAQTGSGILPASNLMGTGNLSLFQNVQTGSGVHPAFYVMCTGSSFPGGNAAGAWRWPLPCLLHSFLTGSGTHPASCLVGTMVNIWIYTRASCTLLRDVILGPAWPKPGSLNS